MKCAFGLWLALMVFAQAGLEFPAVLKEVHAPADAKIVKADFEFTNHSEKTVTVAKVNPTCSCIAVTVENGKLLYAPGESGVIRTEFDMGNFSGVVDKVVGVWLDGDPEDKPSVSLTVRVHIPELVVLEPKTVKWELGGAMEPQSLRIKMDYTQPIHVTGVSSTSEAFKLELKTIEDGKQYELIVTPVKITSAGLAIIRIETDCELKKHYVKQAFAVISKLPSAQVPNKP